MAGVALSTATYRELLPGGYRNQVWKVRSGRRWLIEKRYVEDPGEPNPMYPNLPDHEAAALATLGPRALSPQLVERAPDAISYWFVPGTMWRRGVSEVADLLHAVHSGPAPHGLRRLCVSAQAACAHGDEMAKAVPSSATRELRACRPVDADAAAVQRISLVHTDCGPGNIVRSRHGLVLIDWQCPGLGDPVEDIACFASPAMMILYGFRPHTAAAVDRFLTSYADRVTVDRYRRQGPAWHYRIGAYCVWRADRLARRLPDVAARYRAALAAEIALIKRWP
ncbi:MAG: phosphotransferase [Actinobacteria bacterium]|nr:phosphotransferase [Actinomycetota bacterium]